MKILFLNTGIIFLLVLLLIAFSACKKDERLSNLKPEINSAIKVASTEINDKIQHVSKLADTIVFNGLVSDFKINNIFVSSKEDGILRKVNSVVQQMGKTTLITSPVSIAEAFPNVEFSSDIEITASSIDEIKYNAKGIYLNNNLGGGLNFELKDVVLWDKDGNPTTSDDQVTGDGKLVLQLNPYLKFKNIDGELRSITVGSYPVGTIEMSIDCPIKLEKFEPEPKLLMTIKTKPQIIMIAGVPVIITNEIPIYLGFKGTVKVKLTSGIKNTTSLHAELSWINGEFSFSKSINNNFEAILPSISAEADLQAFITPELNIKLYGVAGPSIDLKGYLIGKAIASAGVGGINISAAIYGGIELSIGVVLKVFDFRLTSYQSPPIISYEYKIKEWTTKNNPPSIPLIIQPLNNAQNVSTSPLLAWSCTDPDGDPLSYNIYFGPTNPPTIKVLTVQTITSVGRQNLELNKSYYWRVIARDNIGDSTSGPVWSFTTSQGINNAPILPSNPSPSDNATGVSTSPTLTWSCSDPENDPLTFDVYLDNSINPTTNIGQNLSTLSTTKSGLNAGVKYYWKVVAKDNQGNVTTGPIWNFTVAPIGNTNGLIAYYPFNGNSNDESGNGNNGTVTGATLTADRFGNSNKAYSFNGSSNFISVPNSSTLNPASQITLSAWVSPSNFYPGSSYGNYIISKGSDASLGFYCLGYATNTKQFVFVIRFSDEKLGTLPSQIYSSTTINLSSWYYVTGTYDGTTMKLYVNAVSEIQKNKTSTLPVNSETLYIGKHSNSSYPYWVNGKIDDIRIYNRALSDQEISVLFNSK